MRRSFPALVALLAVAAAPAPAAAKKAIVGISDQQAQTFANPVFPQLKSKIARYIAPWDVMQDPEQLQKMDAWIQGARAQRQKILIHFEHSRKSVEAGNKAPSVTAFTKELRKFKKAYPDVRDIGVWNEVNRKRVPGQNLGQPVAGKPKLLASYYRATKKVFKGSKYRIVALDVLDENNPTPAIKMVKDFQKAIGAKETRRMILGFHNYSDTNRFATTRTRAILKAFKGKEVWLTETGGIVAFGRSFPFDTERAARAIGCMFKLARSSSKIKRLYIYNFNGAPDGARFDAGLVDVGGNPRAGFAAVVSQKPRNCRK
jgi:hypothetical protein